jgi:hypothetical protein
VHQGLALEVGAPGGPGARLGRDALQEIPPGDLAGKLAVLRALHAKFLTQPRPLRHPPTRMEGLSMSCRR